MGDVETDETLPLSDRRSWLYGWGFSFVFTRAAWELAPFPDVEFAEDSAFMEGLLAQGIPVRFVRLPAGPKGCGLAAHSYHPDSCSGGEFQGSDRCGKPVNMP